MKSAYFNCIGGASGDMLLGALVDVGVPVDELNEAISTLKIKGLSITAEPGLRGGVTGTKISVKADGGTRKRLSWQRMVGVVEESSLHRQVVERVTAVLHRLSEAEAAVHGTDEASGALPHELGDLDTLADVVGSVAGIEALGIERLYSSPFPSGSGVFKSEHGMLPTPAPATAALFAMAKAPVVPPPGNTAAAGEMVTPTGAALITTLASFQQPHIRFEKVGYGLGTRQSPDYPNVLALWLGEETGTGYTTDLTMLETNVDDMTAEMLGYVQERLLDMGARDVWFTPIQMKKGRPGTMLSALVSRDQESEAVALMLSETSSLGVRVRPAARYEAERESVDVETSLGMVSVKVKRLDGRAVAVAPEYEACRAIALDRGMPLQEVYQRVQTEASEELLSR